MKLYYARGSSSLLPHIVLYEAGLPFTAIKIDEHTKIIEDGGDYKSINPLGYVPALALDDGTLLTEGAAIVQYIADQVPSKKLAPPNGTIERTKLQCWLNFLASEMHKGGFAPLFYAGVSEGSRDVFHAIKFTDTGEVRVTAKTSDDHFNVSVSDTGPGNPRGTSVADLRAVPAGRQTPTRGPRASKWNSPPAPSFTGGRHEPEDREYAVHVCAGGEGVG